MKLIGLSGKMGVGKTTVARMLCDAIPGAQKAAFGDLVKTEIAERYGVPLVYLYEAKDKPVWPTPERLAAGWPEIMKTRSMTVRALMQWYGTDFVRRDNPSYWVDAMRRTLGQWKRAGVPGAVIDDVRFPDEAALIRESGGELYRIEAYPGYAPVTRRMRQSRPMPAKPPWMTGRTGTGCSGRSLGSNPWQR